ncbi:MAG TPA: aminoglycoside phosphotransferase family protein [Pyrinomonadaceae bacterium]|nr:aminoglycoside phosphotransferase family protein [Pyrinomonadaceae bacterium]
MSFTAETLSSWLHRSGSLPSGTVNHVQIDLEFEATTSKLVFLNVEYSAEAPADLPQSLVVKIPVDSSAIGDRSSEVQFYRQVASSIGSPPLVRCLATAEDCILVLEDVRGTHDHPPWPLPPSRAQCKLAVDALVKVHVRWWEAPALGHTIGKPHTAESLTNMVQGIAAHLPAFIDAHGDALTIDARNIYERVFSSSLKPWLRLTDERALTIINGDAHTWNFLFPRSGDGPAFLIDWQLWHVDVGARDLAFLMALHWHPSRRRELELPLLRQYHEGLLAHGLNQYSFDELLLDYGRCAVRNLTIPILFWSRGMKPEGWWHRLECALAAYRDLRCDELL